MPCSPVRFLLIGRARSGSTWLGDCLASHRGVCIHDEPLNKESIPLPALEDLPAFVRSMFVPTDSGQQAVGLKLLYDQLSLNERHPGFLLPYWALDAAVHEKYLSLRRKRVHERLLSACPLAHLRRQFRLLRHVLAEDRSLRIIHIRRRNIVRAHLSVVVATRFSWVNSPRAEGPIRLELDALRQAIAQTRLYEAMFRRLFRDHPYREVFYEDLLADLTYELEQLVRFLKLPAGGLAAMPASEQRPLDNEVANLQELRSALRWRDLDALLMTV